jgi:FAD/FMN-containing dehydrogenase
VRRRLRAGAARRPRLAGRARWKALDAAGRRRAARPRAAVRPCLAAASAPACAERFRSASNPYVLSDDPALTQTFGWVDAWTARASAYAVAARRTADVVAAVDFARSHRLRLVVKGGGHKLPGHVERADSLLVWTRRMAAVTLHDAFVAAGLRRPRRAGARGLGRRRRALVAGLRRGDDRRAAATSRAAAACRSGVAGLVQSGGFGSFSKAWGLASGSLLEAEVVTADGAVRIANACSEPELFWGLKGGGGAAWASSPA